MKTLKGVLLVRLCNWVGEAVLSRPALHRLAEAGYELNLYGKAWAPALFEGTGWHVTVRSASMNDSVEQLRSLRRTCTSTVAPSALLMTNSFYSALEARLGGFSPSGYANEGRSPLLSQAFHQQSVAHAAHAYWHLAGCFLSSDAPFPGSLGWTPSDAQRTQAQALLAEHKIAPRSFVIICPFTGADDPMNQKVWPHFRELAAALQAAGTATVICPGPGEEFAASELAPTAICLSGINLGVYGALCELSHCVVANDTGPGHLAAATGASLISISGLCSVPAWTPIGPRVRVFRGASSWPTVETIVAAVLESSSSNLNPAGR